MTRQARPDLIRGAVEEKGNESWMAQQFINSRMQWTKHERIAGLQRRREWTIFRAQVKVSFAEHDRAEAFDVHGIQRGPSGQSYFDSFSSRLVHATETGRQRGGVIRDDEIIRTQKLDERRARNMNDVTLRIDDEKFCVCGTLYCCGCG